MRCVWVDLKKRVIHWQKDDKNIHTMKADAQMEFAQVTNVVTGIQTDVLRRSGSKYNAQLYVSIVAP